MTDPLKPPYGEIATGNTPADGLNHYLDAELARIAPVAIWLSEPDGRLIHCNPEARRMFSAVHGYEPQPGQSIEALIPESRRARWRELYARAASGEQVESDLDVLMPDNQRLIVRIHLRPIPGPDGRILRIIASAKDLTGRRRIEERMLLYRAALDAVDEGIVITEGGAATPSGFRIVYINATMTRMTGYSLEDLLGRCPFDTVGSKLDADSKAVVLDAIERHVDGKIEVEQLRKDGTSYPAECRLIPITGEMGARRHFLTIRRDLTQRNAYDLAKRSKARMEVVGRMSAELAHQFNNLFTLVAGSAELLAQNGALHPQDNALLGTITHAVEEASETTRALLWLSQARVAVPEPLPLAPYLLKFQKHWNSASLPRPALNILAPPDLPSVRADRNDLIHVLDVLGNYYARRPGGGGRLTIQVEAGPLSLGVRFADEGRPLSGKAQGHLFEPFVGDLGEGLGDLQLSAAREAARAWGGELLSRESGNGPVLTLVLSIPESSGRLQSAEPAGLASAERNPLVIIVEDEAKIRTLLTTVLSGGAYQIRAFDSGVNALAALEHAGDAPVLLLTDVVMPGMSGRELADRLLLKWPNLRVIFMSGYSGDTLVQQRVNELGMGFLAKPFTPRQLLGKIEEILALPPRHATG